jgi:hypothetical protein
VRRVGLWEKLVFFRYVELGEDFSKVGSFRLEVYGSLPTL